MLAKNNNKQTRKQSVQPKMIDVAGFKVNADFAELVAKIFGANNKYGNFPKPAEDAFKLFGELLGDVQKEHNALLETRVTKQKELNKKLGELKKAEKFQNQATRGAALLEALRENGRYPAQKSPSQTLAELDAIRASVAANSKTLHPDITNPGSQLVGPAYNARMMLKGLERYQPFNFSISNIIGERLVAASLPDTKENRIAESNKYACEELDKIFKFRNPAGKELKFSEIDSFLIKFDGTLVATRKDVDKTNEQESFAFVSEGKKSFKGFNHPNRDSTFLSDILLESNGVVFEFKLGEEGGLLKDKDGALQILTESNKTVIEDLEDAAHTTAESVIQAYKNLYQAHEGTLSATFPDRNGNLETRKMPPEYTTYRNPITEQEEQLHRRVTPLVRDVGPHMETDSDLITLNGKPIPQKFMDIFMTTIMGYQYHVAPKMQSPEEVKLMMRFLEKLEDKLGLERGWIKVGIMYEEMGVQITEAVKAASNRIFFINSGFMDYTGSVIETGSALGAMVPYTELQNQDYKKDYEKFNAIIGILMGVPQVGGGMHAFVEDAKKCVAGKNGQINMGLSTGWVPKPEFGVIFDMLYAQRDVTAEQAKLITEYRAEPQKLEELLEKMATFPLATHKQISDFNDNKAANIDRAVYELLAYAQPWVQNQVGCSSVKDFDGNLVMEDRATMRIKISWLRNYLEHDVIEIKDVQESIIRMAGRLDREAAETNKKDYTPLVTGRENALRAELEAAAKGDWSKLYQSPSNPVCAVFELIRNPSKAHHALVEEPMNKACDLSHGKGAYKQVALPVVAQQTLSLL